MSTKDKRRAQAIAKAREIKTKVKYAELIIIGVIIASPVILFSIFGY